MTALLLCIEAFEKVDVGTNNTHFGVISITSLPPTPEDSVEDNEQSESSSNISLEDSSNVVASDNYSRQTFSTEMSVQSLQKSLRNYEGLMKDHIMLMSKERTWRPDSGLITIPDEEISRRARDKTLSGQERQRYKKEEKGRGDRNKQKRGKKLPNTSKSIVLPEEEFRAVRPLPELVEPKIAANEGVHFGEDFIKKMEAITGLAGTALIIYLIISEGSRLFPPRNLIPIP